MRRFLTISLSIFLLVIFAFTSVYADITGKIAGRVVDAKTGEPLPGVNVIIIGTQMGAATDMNGYYFIVNIPVGKYSIKASMISYAPTEVSDVQVNVDLTTTVNFKITQQAIRMQTLVVKAKRKMIIADATQTTRVVDASSMTRLPVATFQGVINRQAGVVSGHVRGGRDDEMAYMVDGMSVQNPISGGQGATVGNTAVEQISMLTGGFNAEYGQAMSGVMNIVTREGGRKYSGSMKVLSNSFLPNTISNGDSKLEIGFGGPLGTNNIRFYLSGDIRDVKDRAPYYHVVPDFPVKDDSIAMRYERGYLINVDSASGDIDTIHIGDFTVPYRNQKYGSNYWQDYKYMIPHHGRQTYHTQGKLTFKLSQFKLNLSGFYMRDQYELWHDQWRYHLDNSNSVLQKAYKMQVSLNGMLNSATYFTLNANKFFTGRHLGLRDFAYEQGRYVWDDYKFVQDPMITIYDSILIHNGDTIFATDGATGPESLRNYIWSHIYYPRVIGTENSALCPWGVKPPDARFFMIGDYRDGYFQYQFSDVYNIKGDFNSQITKNHLFKFGGEVKYYHIYSNRVDGPNGTNPFDDNYDVKPWVASGFIQDKMEFEGMVVNAGVRADAFNPKVKYAPDISKQDSSINAEIRYQVSPRLGISFPVTERQVFHLSYGHFFQNPNLSEVYTTLFPDLSRSNQVIGNPGMPAEHTISYEFGLANQIADDMSFDLTWYYKDIFGLVGFQKIVLPGFSSMIYVSGDYGNSKGIEFTLNKRGDMVSGQISYTLSFSEGTAADPWEEYENDYYESDFDLEAFKRKVYPLSFDRRHVLNGNITLAIPGEPNTYISLMGDYQTGQPYTPRDAKGSRVGDYFSARKPATWHTDLKINKEFNFGVIRPNIFFQVTNIFNTINIDDVYENTGKPDDDGAVITESQFKNIDIEYGQSGYTARADRNGDGVVTKHETYLASLEAHNDFVITPNNYGTQRVMMFGIELAW